MATLLLNALWQLCCKKCYVKLTELKRYIEITLLIMKVIS